MPLRILLAVHHYPPQRVGGAELIAARIARWLAEQGHVVQVICIENIQPKSDAALVWQDEQFQDVPVRRLTLGITEPTIHSYFQDARLEEHFSQLIQDFRPDVLHLISGYLMGVAPLHAAFAHQLATVVTLSDFWFICPTIQLLRADGSLCWGPDALECARCITNARRPVRWLENRTPKISRALWRTINVQPILATPLGLKNTMQVSNERARVCMNALNRVDALAPLTDFVVEMHKANGLRADKIVQQLDFFDVADFDAAPTLTRPLNEIRFGYLGQIAPIKGVDVLLRAFVKLKHTYRGEKRLRLDVHGKFNADAHSIKTLQDIAASDADIFLHGAYEHRATLNLLQEMDVVVVPSVWHENVPRVIFEAFAAKRPVIGTRVGGIANVVTDERDGLLFERGNVDDLVRVMQRVIQEPTLLERLAKNTHPPRAFQEDMHALVELYGRAQAHRAMNEP